MEIYKTVDGGNVVMKDNVVIASFDSNIKPIPYVDGPVSGKLRSNSNAYKTIMGTITTKEKKDSNRTLVDKIKGFDVFLDKKDYTLNIDIGGDIIKLDNEGIKKIKSEMSKVEKLKIDIKSKTGNYNLGDRTLIYGPTGTGKTYDFINTVDKMIKNGILDDYEIVTITDGFEDIDFLTHIVPSEKGITYSEKRIVGLLRDAAGGKKVAILLDELNRGGKSFLNLILKLLDAVDGKNYVLSNFVNDENIVIPIENILFFATMNLGGKYVGTNALDEALLDRFNMVLYKGYNETVESSMMDVFGELKSKAKEIVKYVRDIHKDGEIRAPISTRGVKMWGETFLNSGKTKEDFINTFNIVLIKRLISVDDFGNPNREEESLILKKFKDLGFIK